MVGDDEVAANWPCPLLVGSGGTGPTEVVGVAKLATFLFWSLERGNAEKWEFVRRLAEGTSNLM